MATSDQSREDEIRQIEQDLDNLVRSYWALEDAVKWLKLGFGANVMALIAIGLWGVVTDRAGLVAISIGLLLLCGLAVLLGPRSVSPGLAMSGRGVRWIDVVGWKPPGFFGVSVKRSEAMAVEDMIADRRNRLAQLQENPPENPK
jgi:hypothetical protein